MNDVRHSAGGRRLGAAAVALLAIAGCSGAAVEPKDAVSAANSRVASPPVLTLSVVDRIGFDATLAELRGQVVLVDFWAPWCSPCLEQMPHTVQLVKERGAAGFAAVTVCMDDPDNADAVKQLLAARGAAATINLISRDGGGSKAMEAFEVPGGALPHYRVYDRQGKLHASFELDPGASEQFGVADIDKSVAELLSD